MAITIFMPPNAYYNKEGDGDGDDINEDTVTVTGMMT